MPSSPPTGTQGDLKAYFAAADQDGMFQVVQQGTEGRLNDTLGFFTPQEAEAIDELDHFFDHQRFD